MTTDELHAINKFAAVSSNGSLQPNFYPLDLSLIKQ